MNIEKKKYTGAHALINIGTIDFQDNRSLYRQGFGKQLGDRIVFGKANDF